ncbi:dUTP diphosphatase [Metabacillus sp. B2-18]|uniref:dUTP diphosphatase n=1 Tax=Metabacillus sp. B2-18 TaxID=2897333 RepID=UPI001E4B1898|nr:dUTP diphosphatase [Metabacillus sp. B2-18]UGB31685.1 dUTP diphosphatase [Metabacillus sp. B2-18]
MNIKKLFEMQKVLDNHILREQNLNVAPFDKRCLALVVELGECANEEKSFKYWKVPEKRKPNVKALRNPAMMSEDQEWYNPLLDEYVDCLHFVVSLGISIGVDPEKVKPVRINWEEIPEKDLTNHILALTRKVINLNYTRSKPVWFKVYNDFYTFGIMLGFTSEEIEQAYMEKNQINHERQESGY